MSFVDPADTGITAINTALAQEANRIGNDIFTRTLHVSPWIDLIKQSAWKDGMGYQQNTLVYDRAIPTTGTAGNNAGVNWHEMGETETSNTFDTSLATGRNFLDDATRQTAGNNGGDASGDNDVENDGDQRSFINFSKQIKPYRLRRAVIESPKLSLEDLRFAAHRQEQLRAVIDLMAEASRYTWENRYRDEYERVCGNLVPALAAATPILDTVDGDGNGTADNKFEGVSLAGTLDLSTSGAGNTDVTPDANISNAILDKVYYQLIRKGAAGQAYGRENGRPVFGLILSSEASYALMTEAEFRDDTRYNSAKVSDLLAPLGIEKSWRGFYHLVDDLAPRFTASGGVLTRVLPYTVAGGITAINPAYDTASFEAVFVLHPEVMESEIPNPFSGTQGVTFDPQNFRGDFKWQNNRHDVRNPDGTIGFFRGVLASATKPIKTDFGYVMLIKRDSSTPAA